MVQASNPKVVYEQPDNLTFMDEITVLPEGETLLSCIQCGTCSGTCPVSTVMQYPPRRIFAMIRAGLKDEVLKANTPWICASCYMCTVDCPAEIKITEIMYALKRQAIREGVDLPDPKSKLFYSIFNDQVRKYGRVHELGMMIRFVALRDPIRLLKNLPIGMHLFFSGLMPLFPHNVKKIDSLQKIIDKAMEIDNGGSV